MVVCAGCERPILDRFLFNVLDRAWHAKCVQCADCKSSLTDKCFSRDGKLFCRDDFFRRFGTKCGGCAQGISPNDLVRRARNKVFHLKCFTCMVCRKQLSTGEELYVLDENKFICKEDYLNSSDGEDLDGDLDSQLLDKIEDTLSDKDISMDGEDSRDSHSLTTAGTHPLSAHNNNNNNNNNNNSNNSGSNTALTSNTTNSVVGSLDNAPLEKNNNGTVGVNNGTGGGGVNGPNCSVPSSPNNNNKENNDKLYNSDPKTSPEASPEPEDAEMVADGANSGSGETQVGGTKRRGPRTTIKAKQLETLKAAFAATPKPTRHIREQLAQETGLNMRVIQVWFQNRRSKERRMKQLSALGARRHFFRNPRRMRGLRDGEMEGSPDMMAQHGFNYFENGEFYPGYPGYGEYFPGQGDPANFLPSSGPQGMGPDFGLGPGDMLPPTSSPEPNLPPMHHPDGPYGGPPRSMAPTGFGQGLPHPPPEMAEAW